MNLKVNTLTKIATQVAKRSQAIFAKNAPSILTALGVMGVFSTAALAVKATPVALDDLDKAQEYFDRPMTKSETVQTVWKRYVPAASVGIGTVVCIISANSINLKRNAALAGLYSLSERALTEYQNKVIENLGAEKEREIRKQFTDSRIDTGLSEQEVIHQSKGGSTLCLETITNQLFRSDGQMLRKIENDLNFRIRREMWITLNDLFYELNFPPSPIGDNVGWNIHTPLEFKTTAQMHESRMEPYIVLEYRWQPFESFRVP